MSSTLFGRGVNTQVGLARRNQEMTKSIAFAVAAAESVKTLPDELQFMKSQIVALERRLAATEMKLEQALADKKAATEAPTAY
jgi:ABC-type thiamine transport system ATPase subunit